MKLSDYVIDFLVSERVTHIFEVAGGALAHLLDSLYERKDISTVSLHHEMAAAMAAEGYSRVSGNLGVAMATSGPGATNLVTGIGSCFFDSVPCLFITGQVNTFEFKFDLPVRQIGFQETDIANIIKPIVKDALLLTDADNIKYSLTKLVHTSKSGRPGPVLLDIPLDIQRAEIKVSSLKSFSKEADKELLEFDDSKAKKVMKLINSSSRPVVLVGGGVRISKATKELFELISKTKFPVVTSLMGLDAFPHDDESFVGMIGVYGNRYANLAIANSDLVIALGTRLDTRQTGTKPKTFAREAKIIHVDIDKHELNNKINADLPVNCDIKPFLDKLNDHIANYDTNKISQWREKIGSYKKKYPSHKVSGREDIDPNFFIHTLSDFVPSDSVICMDIGQIQLWTAQSFKVKKEQRVLTEGGMAALGSALPMAIGASFANPKKTIVVIVGDGGFQFSIQELQTVYQHNLPIKIIMINNSCYGMVRQFQEQYFNSRFQSTVKGYSYPDFQDVVSAYKIPSRKIVHNKDISEALKDIFSDSKPGFLEVGIGQECKLFPKLSVNHPVEDQDPLLPRDELKSDMIIDMLDDKKEKTKRV